MRLHKLLGLLFSPFYLLTCVTGIALFWRKDDLYPKETKELLVGLHNWELAARYVGVVLAVALVVQLSSGWYLYLKGRRSSDE